MFFTAAEVRNRLGEPVEASQLVPTADLVEQHRQIEEGDVAMRRFFQGGLTLDLPFFPPRMPPEPPPDVAEAISVLHHTREQMLSGAALFPIVAGG